MSEQLASPNDDTSSSKIKLLPIFLTLLGLMMAIGLLVYLYIDNIPPTTRQHSSSYSMYGHRALRETLQKLGYKVGVNNNPILSDEIATILYIAPQESHVENFLQRSIEDEIRDHLRSKTNVLVACPKWYVRPNLSEADKTASVSLEPSEVPEKLIRNFEKYATLKRTKITTPTQVSYYGRLYNIDVPDLQVFEKHHSLVPVVSSDYGPIAIEVDNYRGGKLIVVSDPDIFTNGGIGRADNGILAIHLIESIAKEGEIWIDEIAHGLGRDVGIVKILFTFPVACVTFQVIFLLLAWIRYANRPFIKFLLEPKMERSRKEQVESIAYLAYASKQHPFFLSKYFKYVVQSMQERYPSLKNLSFEEQLEHLDYIGKQRGVQQSIKSIYNDVINVKNNQQQIRKCIKNIYTWKEKIFYGKHS